MRSPPDNSPERPHPGAASDNPEIMRPLEPFGGAKPPAPAWFDTALACLPERSFVDFEGASVEMLCWGERGAPGLLLVHGTNAHADWWSFIAPFFEATHRIVALSLSGMGRSAWRERYSVTGYGREVLAIAEAGGAFEGCARPIAIGHSFGGMIVSNAMAQAGERFAGAVLVDSLFLSPAELPDLPVRRSPNRIMATMEEAVSRFRLVPAQPVVNAYALDHIARHSVKPVEGGVTWCFDPFIFARMTDGIDGSVIGRVRTPMALMRGDRSGIVTEESFEYPRRELGYDPPEIVIPDADHHLLIDQPLALVAALRGLLSAWPDRRRD